MFPFVPLDQLRRDYSGRLICTDGFIGSGSRLVIKSDEGSDPEGFNRELHPSSTSIDAENSVSLQAHPFLGERYRWCRKVLWENQEGLVRVVGIYHASMTFGGNKGSIYVTDAWYVDRSRDQILRRAS